MQEGAMPAPGAQAAGDFGQVARDAVRAPGGGCLAWEGLELSSLFQPIHCVERAAILGHEGLGRALDPAGRVLRARTLFASMEPARAIRFDWTCRALHLRNYAVVDPAEHCLFLNAHPAAIVADADGGRAFAELVRFYGLAPERVFIEVLEMDSGDERALAEALAGYRDRGFCIAMDHFGRGRSNFDRIALLRPRIVKVDRLALGEALGDTQGRRKLAAFVGMLKDTGAQVAVKGIVNAHDALAAIEAGADYLQGFHLGAPSRVPGDEGLARSLIHSARRLAAA